MWRITLIWSAAMCRAIRVISATMTASWLALQNLPTVSCSAATATGRLAWRRWRRRQHFCCWLPDQTQWGHKPDNQQLTIQNKAVRIGNDPECFFYSENCLPNHYSSVSFEIYLRIWMTSSDSILLFQSISLFGPCRWCARMFNNKSCEQNCIVDINKVVEVDIAVVDIIRLSHLLFQFFRCLADTLDHFTKAFDSYQLIPAV